MQSASPFKLTHTCSANKTDLHDINKLNKKIKVIKTHLKMADQQNLQVKSQLISQRNKFILEKKQLLHQIQRYKKQYQIQVEKTELKYHELDKIRENNLKLQQKKIKTQVFDQTNNTFNQYKEIIARMQIKIDNLKKQNQYVNQELEIKIQQVVELQIMLKNYKEKILNKNAEIQTIIKLKMIIQEKSGENMCLRRQIQDYQREKVINIQKMNEKDQILTSIQTKIANLQEDLKNEKEKMINYSNKLQQTTRKYKQYEQYYDECNLKYNTILKEQFQYQKDFEKELHTIAKQITRREIK